MASCFAFLGPGRQASQRQSFEFGMRVKGARLREGVDLELYFHIHTLSPCCTCYSTRRLSIVRQKGSQGPLDH